MTDINAFVRDLRVALVFNADTEQAVKDLETLDKKLKKIEETTQKAEQKFRDLEDVSVRAAAASAAIFAPAVLSAQKYVEAAGRSEAVSRRWMDATTRQQKAQIELGRKSAQALLPYQEALTKVVELAAKLPPGVFDAGLALGGGIALVGAVGILTSQIGIFVTTATRLIASINASTTGSVAGKAAVTPFALAAGAGIGTGIVRAGGAATGNERLQNFGGEEIKQGLFTVLVLFTRAVQEAADTTATLAGIYGGLALKVQEQGIKFAANLGEMRLSLLEQLEKLVVGFEEAWLGLQVAIGSIKIDGGVFGELNLGKELGIDLDAVYQRLDDLSDSTSSYADERQRLHEDEAAALANLEQRTGAFANRIEALRSEIDGVDLTALETFFAEAFGFMDDPKFGRGEYGADVLDAFAQFQEDSVTLQNEYFAERTAKQKAFEDESLKLQENYNEQQAKLTENYNEQRKQAETAFQQKVADLRNAAQVDLLQRETEYRDERTALQDDFREEEQKATEAYNRKRVQAEKDFQDQLRNAAAKLDATSVLDILRNQHKQRGTDSDQFSLEAKQRKDELQDRLNDLDKAHRKEQQQRRDQLRQQIKDAEKAFTEQQRQQQAAYEKQSRDAADQYRKLQNERTSAHQKELEQLRTQHNRTMQERDRQFRDQYDQLMGFGRYSAEGIRRQLEETARLLDDYRNRNVIPATVSKVASNITKGLRFFHGGGYTEDEIAVLKKREFVMDTETTKAAERGMGALTQQKLQQVFSGGNRSYGDVHVSINGSVGQGTPADFARAFRREYLNVLREMATT